MDRRRDDQVNLPREHDERSTDHGVRFYGVVTLGNLLSAIPVLVAVVLWGARLEGRVDHEVDLRTRMETQIKKIEESSAALNTRIDERLTRITDGITDLKLAVVELRKQPLRDPGNSK